MKPIPKNLLIHSAYALKLSKPERWGERSEEKRTELSRIRIEPSSTLRLSKSNEQVQLAAVLFYDCRNSRPAGIDFSLIDKIEFEGEKYNIVGIRRHYDDKKLHHVEVELCL